MKILFILLFSSFLLSNSAFGQIPADAKLTSIRKVNGIIEVAVKAKGEFYVGNNTFVLKTGNRSFSLYRQITEDGDGSGMLVFLVPEQDYKQLSETDKVYLTYGQISPDGASEDLIDVCHEAPTSCKYLGVLSKYLIIK